MDTLAWSPHMQECLEVLEETREDPLDEVLVALVRLQYIADEAHKLLRREISDDTNQSPPHGFRKGLVIQFDGLVARLSPTVKENCA